MSNYTFTFKKDDVFVEFLTTERDVVTKQFEIWVEGADKYVAEQAGKKTKESAMPKEDKEDCPAFAPKMEEQSVVSKPLTPPVAEIVEEKKEQEVVDQRTEPVSEIIIESGASTTINEILKPQEPVENIQEPANFGEVLDKSLENPTFEPNKVKDQVFVNFVNSKHTNDKFHYLIITAYYLSEFEKSERFSLKQINSKLVQNFSEIVDHTTLQDAIAQGFIELVPDLTGTSEIAEYRLTSTGEDFFVNRI